MSITSSQMSSEDRPVGLRTRHDLVIQESIYQGELCWIVKDPLAMKYFRLRKPEYLVLEQLRESASYQGIKQALIQAFPEFTIRLEAVQQLIVSLHKFGLLVSNESGQSEPLIKRRNKELQQKALGLMSSLVSMRFPGWDPEKLLNWMYPKCRWIFSYWFTTIVITTCLGALLLVGANFNTFYSKLPDFQSFFAFDNLLFMGVILIATKSIHEFGHGLTCKHFGGECHEIGFMLLVMTPAMYCNTSDSWIMPNRWHRIAIGAAGIYVELFLAAVCTFIWWFTHPGWIHYTALNIMFLSSVSTVVFNANPLLRYDGYYMLSDLLEIPNMAQKAKQALISKLRVWCLGMKPVSPRMLPERHQLLFAIYSVGSFVYRWVVMILIFWFVSEIFAPYGLEAIGHVVIGISLFGMVVVPFYKMVKFFLFPGRLREVKKFRFYSTITAVSLFLAFFCLYPFPHYVWAPFVIRPVAAQQLVLQESGRLSEQLVSPGSQVQQGQPLAIIKNETLELELKELQVESARLRSDLLAYEVSSNVQLSSASRISEIRAQLETVEEQIELQQQKIEELIIRAERSGTIFMPTNLVSRPTSDPELPSWYGTPLDPNNRNAFLESNTMYGTVGNANEMEAMFAIDQSEIKLLSPGQKVIAQLQTYGSNLLRTEISYVSQDELTNVPKELSQTNGGPIAVKPDETGKEAPILKHYEARAQFEPNQLKQQSLRLLPGMRGQAKILVGTSSLGNRLRRYLSTIINFR